MGHALCSGPIQPHYCRTPDEEIAQVDAAAAAAPSVTDDLDFDPETGEALPLKDNPDVQVSQFSTCETCSKQLIGMYPQEHHDRRSSGGAFKALRSRF